MGHRVQTVSTPVTKKDMKTDTKWTKQTLVVSEGFGEAWGRGVIGGLKDMRRKC